MTHYAVLGVADDATLAEIRRAYVRLAREHHPDRHAHGSPAERAAAEQRMRAINAAWGELRDPERRRRYDLGLRAPQGPSWGGTAFEEDPGPSWEPYDLGDEDDLDLDELYGERRARPPRGGRTLTMLPAVCVVGGVGALIVGAVVDLGALAALGLSALVLGAVLFALVPFFVVLDSRRHDRL